MIEIEKTYRITFTEEQLQALYNLLHCQDVNDLRKTSLTSIYHEIKDITNPHSFN